MLRDMFPRHTCWVCDTPNELEEHHVIPRAYGGNNGPLCVICAVCHSAVHKIALMKVNSGIPPLNERWTANSIPKVEYLSLMIRRAKAATAKDTNKAFLLNLRLKGSVGVQLKEIQYALGLKSQNQAIEAAIDSFHQSIFRG